MDSRLQKTETTPREVNRSLTNLTGIVCNSRAVGHETEAFSFLKDNHLKQQFQVLCGSGCD
jgi:hypothetical protein